MLSSPVARSSWSATAFRICKDGENSSSHYKLNEDRKRNLSVVNSNKTCLIFYNTWGAEMHCTSTNSLTKHSSSRGESRHECHLTLTVVGNRWRSEQFEFNTPASSVYMRMFFYVYSVFTFSKIHLIIGGESRWELVRSIKANGVIIFSNENIWTQMHLHIFSTMFTHAQKELIFLMNARCKRFDFLMSWHIIYVVNEHDQSAGFIKPIVVLFC